MSGAPENTVVDGCSPHDWGLVARDDGFVYLHGRPWVLPPKEQAVLHLMLSQWPKVVSKDRFAQGVWPGQVMSDESLARCITQLRQRLSRDVGVGIQSIYRRGYQLALPQDRVPPMTLPSVSHSRYLYEAKAEPHQVAALTYARQLTQRRTPATLLLSKRLLTELIEQAPEYVAAKLAFAECLSYTMSSGLELDPALAEEGLKYLAQVQQVAPNIPGLQTETAHLLDCCWRFDDAAKWHRQALHTAPEDSATHYHLGWHLLATGRPHAAVRSLRIAQQLNPYSVNATILLARALFTSGEEHQALKLIQDMYECEPENIKTRVYLLACQAAIEPTSKLIDQAKALQTSQHTWAYAGSSLAYTLTRCGAIEDALLMISAIEKADVGVRINYLTTLLLLKRLDQASQWVQEALEIGCGQLPLILHARENSMLYRHADFAEMHKLLPTCNIDALS